MEKIELTDEMCGESYDHDLDPADIEEWPEGPWVCRRSECGAEIYPDEED